MEGAPSARFFSLGGGGEQPREMRAKFGTFSAMVKWVSKGKSQNGPRSPNYCRTTRQPLELK
jgi:hypothetical protein